MWAALTCYGAVMKYVDGFLLVIPTKNMGKYTALSKKAGKLWMEHGALEYCECVGDDLDVKFGVPFPKRTRVKRGESVLFSWVVYKSKAQRDRINKKVMADPRMAKLAQDEMPFDMKKMSYGGFKTLVDL